MRHPPDIIKICGRYFELIGVVNLTCPVTITITNHTLDQGSYDFKFVGEMNEHYKFITGLTFIFRDTHATELMYMGLRQKGKVLPRIEATNVWSVSIPYDTILRVGRIDGIPSLPYTSWDFSDELNQRPLEIEPGAEIQLTFSAILCAWHTQIVYVNFNGILARECEQDEIDRLYAEHRLPT